MKILSGSIYNKGEKLFNPAPLLNSIFSTNHLEIQASHTLHSLYKTICHFHRASLVIELSLYRSSDLGRGSEDRARDGEAPLDMAQVLSHDGESTALCVAWWSHNTLQWRHGT